MTTNEQPTTPTPASEWAKARHGELYILPGCGMVARLRRPSLAAMAIKAGQVPNPLSAEVLRFLAVVDTEEKTPEQQIEHYRKNVKAYLDMAQLVFVEPRFTLKDEPNYEAGEIGPQDLTDADYAWIWSTLIYGRADELRPFRVGARTPERGRDSAAIWDEAEHAA